MNKSLHLQNLKRALEQAGLSQFAIAQDLGVSREAVSKWMSGKRFPRPDKLLRLGLALNLSLDDLVVRSEDRFEPVIAFRKRGASKTTLAHIARARDMGRLLSSMVPYLPFDLLVRPAFLKNPTAEYGYVQRVAAKIRAELGVGSRDELGFSDLIKRFDDLQAVIIPVLWGKKQKHENALHIYLPESMTSWVFLNLDVEVHDFKFWMAHELGHVYAPDLIEDEGEDFADNLAGALVFPESLTAPAYADVVRSRTVNTRIEKIRKYAKCYSISLITVCYEINKYASHQNLEKIELGSALFGANTNFNKKFHTLSEAIFESREPVAQRLIRVGSEVFDTPFFDVLKRYIVEQKKSAGFVQSILDIPLLDAKEIHAELS